MSLFVKDISATLGTRVILLFVGFFTNVFVANSLGSERLGAFSLVMTTLAWLTLCAGFGIDASNVYFAGQKRWTTASLVANSLWIALLGGVLASVLFLSVQNWAFETILKGVDPKWQFVGLLALPVMVARNSLQGILRGTNRILEWNGTALANAALLLLLFLILLKGAGLGVLGAVSTHLIVAFLMTVTLLFILSRGSKLSWKIHWQGMKESLGYGLKIQSSNVINFFNYYLNYYLLNYFLSTTEVGQYSVAMALSQPLMILPAAIQYVLLPKVSITQTSEAKIWMPLLLRLTVFLMLSMLCVFLLVCPLVIAWFYGDEYAASVLPLRLLISGCLFLSIATVTSGYNAGSGRPEISIYSSGLGLVTTVTLGIWLIPTYGLAAAGFTSAVAYFVLAVIEFIGYLRVSGNGMAESLIIRGEDFRFTFNSLRSMATHWKARFDLEKGKD